MRPRTTETGCLMLGGGEGMEIRQRDIKRAELVREKLK